VTLTLRPHHILCRLGFVGYGYSPEFVEEMARIVKTLASGRVKTIILRNGFDNVCRACPHQEGECGPERLGSRGKAAADFDTRTLRALKLKLGHPYPLPEINYRIASLTPQQFAEICKGCEWQPLGACAKGHAALRKSFGF
jgi:uncharacterized protein